jgi:hypothetical protein
MVVSKEPSWKVMVCIRVSSSKALDRMTVIELGITATPEQPKALLTSVPTMVKDPDVQLPGAGALAPAGTTLTPASTIATDKATK